jgi:hypothetical protein
MSIGDAVATKFDIFGAGAELEGGPVPAVGRSQECLANAKTIFIRSRQEFAIGTDLCKRALPARGQMSARISLMQPGVRRGGIDKAN